MAFDPLQEDCLRLVLASLKRERTPLTDAIAVQRLANAFRADPASLIHTDRDRSFHLVAKATELVDYRIPMLVDDAEIDHLAELAENYLREAAELDPGNWDAARMLAAMDAPTNDAYVSYLLDNRERVERDTDVLREQASDPYEREFANDLGQRPYLRWLAALASRALIAGQYRLSLSYAEESLAFAPQDPAGVRHTATLAMAKLEVDPEDLKTFRTQHTAAYQTSAPQRRRRASAEREVDAWSLIADMSLAYRALDFPGATHALRTIMRTYPHAAEALFYQSEFPDGLFGRVNAEPGSADELVLALSEATPLLQEGVGAPEDASFSTWIAEHELVQNALGNHISRAQMRMEQVHRGGEN